MKKVRVLVAVIAAALMIMGAGYAVVWSQTLVTKVNGTVANMDLVATPNSDGVEVSQGGTIHITAPALSPSNGTQDFSITITNNGNAAAKLNNYVITAQNNTNKLRLLFGQGYDKYIDTTMNGAGDISVIWYKAPIVIPAHSSVNVWLAVALPAGAIAADYSDTYSFNVNANYILD